MSQTSLPAVPAAPPSPEQRGWNGWHPRTPPSPVKFAWKWILLSPAPHPGSPRSVTDAGSPGKSSKSILPDRGVPQGFLQKNHRPDGIPGKPGGSIPQNQAGGFPFLTPSVRAETGIEEMRFGASNVHTVQVLRTDCHAFHWAGSPGPSRNEGHNSCPPPTSSLPR